MTSMIHEADISPLKPLIWVGSSGKDFRAFPDFVKDEVGYALFLAQKGGKHEKAKPLKGFGGAGVIEVVTDHRGDTFRTVYMVKLAEGFMCCTRSRRNPRRDVKRRKTRLG